MDVLKLIALWWHFYIVTANLNSVLHHYETLHHNHLKHHVVKRSTGDTRVRQVEFDSLGRHFHLFLRQKTKVLAPNFRVVAVDSDDNEREVNLDMKNFYQGYDLEEPRSSHVSAYWEDDDTMTASIRTTNETYLIEPSWRHLPESDNVTMIAYKKSDLHFEDDLGKNYCGYVKEQGSEEYKRNQNFEEHDEEMESASRVKRQSGSAFSFTPAQNSCPLYLVADYRFYESMGQRNLYRTTSYLLGLIDQVDSIYRQTDFGGFTNMGFEVKEVKIHEFPTKVQGLDLHYNMNRTSWDTKALLEVFSRYAKYRSYCLAHLFTHTAFSGGVLGLAYIGSPRTYSVGGICSPAYYKNQRQLYLNTGWSSSLNRYNRRLLTQESLLVTTHEFGHNWGSEHDPDTDECSPDAFHGGKYIMYTYSVSGYDANNKAFSNCTRRAIGTVLQSKSSKCFAAKSDSFCGNFRIEGSEECDAGPDGKKGNDSCCDADCFLKPGKLCSDANHDCCTNCVYTVAETVCHKEQEGACVGEAKCDGNSDTCPPPAHKDNHVPCLNMGTCLDGVCRPFCESYKKISCACDEVKDACKWCCRDSLSGKCKPFVGNSTAKSLPLPDGVPCVQGICETGICKKQVQDLIERLWDVIENTTPDQFVEFMRANIVGTVIVFSLGIWIPASCVISYIDRKKKREDEKQRMWLKHDNPMLQPELPRDQAFNVRRAAVRARRTPQGRQPPGEGVHPEHRVAAPANKLFIPPRGAPAGGPGAYGSGPGGYGGGPVGYGGPGGQRPPAYESQPVPIPHAKSTFI